MDATRRNKLIAAAFAGVMLLVLVLVSVGGGGSAGDTSTTSSPEASTDETPSFTLFPGERSNGTDVAPLECFPLLELEAVEEALGVADRPEDERGLFGRGDGEACIRMLVADNRFSVGISPAEPSDFLPGTNMLGVTGEPVTGIGDESFWFGGERAEGGGQAGLLIVSQTTDLGTLQFRLGLGRPDLDSSAQLAIVKKLASRVLVRFPGVEEPATPTPADPTFALAFEEEEVDRSNVSFVNNLLAKEEAGEWTRGEGLVATLKLFVGEADAADVLRHTDILQKEGTGILKMASKYLDDDGRDPAAAAEIARLLDLRLFPNAELEAMAGISPSAAAGTAQRVAFVFPQQSVELCGNFFHGAIAPGVGTCLEWRPANVPGGLEEDKYRVFIPSPDLPQGGWTEGDFDLALGALEFSAQWFEGQGKMPPVNLVFSVSPGSPALAAAWPVLGLHCGVVLYRDLQTITSEQFQQTIAHELAHCFQTENFPEQDLYPTSMWREEGLAEYLSNRVYKDVNYEWEWVDEASSLTRTTTLFDIDYGNFLFFQYLEEEIGLGGIFSLVGALPTGGDRGNQEVGLAVYPSMKEIFQRFAESMIDGDIKDTGGGKVPLMMEYDSKTLTGPGKATLDFKPFGVARKRLVVENCKRAHLDVNLQMTKDSARPEANNEWVDLPSTLPRSLIDDHDRIHVLTSTTKGKATIEVTDVDDDPLCEADSAPPPPEPCPRFCSPSDYYRSATNPILR